MHSVSCPSSSRFSLLARLGPALLISVVLAAILSLGSSAIAERAYAATDDQAPTIKWVVKSSNVYCKVNGATQKGGIKTINGKKYLFDKKGKQQTGWHKIGKYYYYFTPKTKAKGAMVTKKVVNGIRLDAKGRAQLNDTARAELNVLVRATAFVEKYTKATWTEKKKLRVCYNVLRDRYPERSLRGFSARAGWHRTFALDILQKGAGDCNSYGAAFAYIANAIGCKNCKVIASGGHGWAEVNGKVYDPEWAKHCKVDLFAFSYSNSGRWGTPGYSRARKYVVTIAPRTKAFGGKSSPSAGKSFGGKVGLVTNKGKRYFIMAGKAVTNSWETWNGSQYYFKKDGVAATGPTKIKGTWYVFDAKGRLLTGKKTCVVTVAGLKYRVTKDGKAKSGWDANKTHRYAENGKMYTGIVVIGEKFFAFGANGTYNSRKTQQLQSCAVMDADAAPLLALLGTPLKTSYEASCRVMTDNQGNQMSGLDGRLVYDGFTVYTFKASNGIEYYSGALSR